LGCSYRRLIGWFWEARAKAGMKHVQFRDLRHTCASMLINRGVDLYTVGKILGHTTPMTTQRYSHLNQMTLKKAMAKLR
jgi:integrase